MARVELTWDGKTTEIERLRLPLQTVEVVELVRASRGTLAEHAVHDSEWRNKLIWGDNRLVLDSLAHDLAGQVDLIYIDPPFDSRQNYKVRITVGDASGEQDLSKLQSIVEEKAYHDTWGAGVESYVQMLYTRLLLLRDLLSDRGSIFLHLAPNVSHLARVLMDEVFGADNFRAEIAWKRTTAHADTKDFGGVHDSILCFSKSQNHIWHPQFRPYDDSYIASHYTGVESDGRRYMLDNMRSPNPRPNLMYEWKGYKPHPNGWAYSQETMAKLDAEGRVYYPPSKDQKPRLKRYLDERPGMPISDVWDDIGPINSQAKEQRGYDTQKPEALLKRIIESSSDPDSIVLDCFAGSGTTAAVAEKLGRRWVAVDIGRFAIHTTRKRMLDIEGCRPFEVANLGRYERQVWQDAKTGSAVAAYFDFIVELYNGQPLDGFIHLHGTHGSAAVHVGAIDAPVTLDEIAAALDEAVGAGFKALDVLGWEWELGLHQLVEDDAKEKGIALRLRRIPSEIMDNRALDDVEFHELAYVQLSTKASKRHAHVTLEDFVLPHLELVPKAVREKVSQWSDYVDYWGVDFDYDGATFRNTWQAYRTLASPSLGLVADHMYDGAGEHTVLVKVVDVFGHDTSSAIRVQVK